MWHEIGDELVFTEHISYCNSLPIFSQLCNLILAHTELWGVSYDATGKMLELSWWLSIAAIQNNRKQKIV